MKELFKMVLVLTLICLLGGVLLAVVNDVTREPILQAAQKEKATAIMKVLPPCDNDPLEDAVTVDGAQGAQTFYVARRAGAFAGAAFVVTSSEGYGGDIDVMVGVAADDTVQAIEILAHKETPGLGARIKEPGFLARFAGQSVPGTHWAVMKDGGDIDQITAATISSRAVTKAVKAGLDVYTSHKDDLL